MVRKSTIFAMPSRVVVMVVPLVDALLRMREQSEQIVQAVCAGQSSTAKHQHSDRAPMILLFIFVSCEPRNVGLSAGYAVRTANSHHPASGAEGSEPLAHCAFRFSLIQPYRVTCTHPTLRGSQETKMKSRIIGAAIEC